MKSKINVLVITAILTILIFALSTYVQKQLIDYEPTISCLMIAEDIIANEKIEKEMFITKELPISVVSNVRIVQTFSEIEGLYANTDIYNGQIALRDQFGTKEELSIFEAEAGKEKISIKIVAAESGVSYAIKENSLVNIYATIRNDYANDFLMENERMEIGGEYDGYTVIKILDRAKILGTFDIDGFEVKNTGNKIIDTIMVAVSSEEAKQINLIRDIATFNMTGVEEENDRPVQSEVIGE